MIDDHLIAREHAYELLIALRNIVHEQERLGAVERRKREAVLTALCSQAKVAKDLLVKLNIR